MPSRSGHDHRRAVGADAASTNQVCARTAASTSNISLDEMDARCSARFRVCVRFLLRAASGTATHTGGGSSVWKAMRFRGTDTRRCMVCDLRLRFRVDSRRRYLRDDCTRVAGAHPTLAVQSGAGRPSLLSQCAASRGEEARRLATLLSQVRSLQAGSRPPLTRAGPMHPLLSTLGPMVKQCDRCAGRRGAMPG